MKRLKNRKLFRSFSWWLRGERSRGKNRRVRDPSSLLGKRYNSHYFRKRKAFLAKHPNTVIFFEHTLYYTEPYLRRG
jgi:hypothetical protein